MDLESQEIDNETLKQMSYSELRKIASKYGIQQMKADKLVSAIMSKVSSTENADSDADYFSTPASKLLNSSKKNKETLFDTNQKTPLVTPRRGTFTVETPSFVITSNPFATLEDSASDLDTSNITFSRGSERKLRSRKVSFMSPTLTPRTPRCQTLRNRPKTPIATRTPLVETDDLDSNSVEPNRKSPSKSSETNVAKMIWESDDKTENVGKNIATPLPSSVQKSGKQAKLSRAQISPKSARDVKTEEVEENISTPVASSLQKSENSGFVKIYPDRKSKTMVSFVNTGDSRGQSAVKEPTSLKKKQTPNFKKIHQKAFDKMESIDDYQKRKLLNSAKKLAQHTRIQSKVTKARSKIPAFSGIPFLSSLDTKSSIKSSGDIICTRANSTRASLKSKENVFKFATHNRSINKKQNLPKTPVPAKSKSKLDLETSLRKKDTPISAKSKSKFDLKESLSRKLNYRPHRGPLKPLSVANTTSLSTSILLPKEPVVNKIVTKNRSQNRSMIRGVRVNKRFELQMKNRKLN